MLRAAAAQTVRWNRSLATNSSWSKRALVTSAQKRSLNKQQLDGSKEKTSPTAVDGSASSAATPGTTTPSGSGSAVLPVLALTAAAAGGAYYMDLIPFDGVMKEKPIESKEEKPVEKSEVEKLEAKKGPAEESEKVQITDSGLSTVDAPSSIGNRVTKISFPPPDLLNRPVQKVPPVEHIPGGNRVSVETLNSIWFGIEPAAEDKSDSSTEDVSDKTPVSEEKVEEPVPSETIIPPPATAIDAASELKSSDENSIDTTLLKAHTVLRANVNESFLKDLDNLTSSQLRIRVVQLAAEMEERTKWEAVRLKEFLSMKEKEVADKYLEIMQKQRLEFEDLLARRLREQEDHMAKQANTAMQAKDESIQSLVDAAASAQQAEFEAELKSVTDRLQREYSAKYETEFGSKLAEEKTNFEKELSEKVETMEELANRLRKLEQLLEISRNFESGSQRAHRVSAAALALSEKMASSSGAAEEVAGLKAAASENGVIASALEKIPVSIKAGIPTQSELQADFGNVYSVARQAALVPEGRHGVEGQLAGFLFASVTAPPSVDSAPPSQDGKGTESRITDFVLSCAKHHVQIGDLEQAITELDKLKGQSAFAVKDWKKAAMDRIAVDKALKVIKMECALMNKNMSG